MLPLTVAQALAQAKQQGLALLDSQILLLLALNKPIEQRTWLLAHDSELLSLSQQQQFISFCQQRSSGVPIAYLIGYKEFYSLQLQVNQKVLIPRPETETLVDWALQILQQSNKHAPKVMDLGTGSGAIACALKANFTSGQVSALDASLDALQVAKANARQHGLIIDFIHSNWLQQISSDNKFDLIVANPPYIQENDPHLAELSYEPQQALVAQDNGLADIKQIIQQATQHLTNGAWLLFEHGYNQAQLVAQILQQYGYSNIEHRLDLAQIKRCTGAKFNY